jgi:hypothetical protein
MFGRWAPEAKGSRYFSMLSLEWFRRARWISLGLALAMSPSALVGCAPSEEDPAPYEDGAIDEIANVTQTAVKRQSIGNCWIYATLGWVESMNRTRTGVSANYSESYVTFWDWFTKITSGGSGVGSTTTNNVTTRTIETGGSWQLAATLIKQRGIMTEGDFIPDEATAEMSARQAAAERIVNQSLSDGGELATLEARRDGARVFAVLARAWSLSPSVVTTLKNVFGNGGEKRFDSYSSRATSTRTRAKPASSILVRTAVRSGTTVTQVNTTLADVLPGGTYAWRAYDYPGTWNTSARPEAMRRMLRALNADAPVIVSWLVDFNALDNSGAFRMEQLRTAARPGRQGGHLTVLHDYQATVAGGRVLAAGQPASVADRELALTVMPDFIRVKNSWGVSRSDRASMQGYYDLYLTYLHGPIDWVNESNPMGPRSQYAPLNEMIIPQGF